MPLRKHNVGCCCGCAECNGGTPDQIEVVLSAFSTWTCIGCATEINGTHVLSRLAPGCLFPIDEGPLPAFTGTLADEGCCWCKTTTVECGPYDVLPLTLQVCATPLLNPASTQIRLYTRAGTYDALDHSKWKLWSSIGSVASHDCNNWADVELQGFDGSGSRPLCFLIGAPLTNARISAI